LDFTRGSGLDRPGDDALPRALASKVDHQVVGVAIDALPAPAQLGVEVIEHDVGK
jgi:hypothetical protein